MARRPLTPRRNRLASIERRVDLDDDSGGQEAVWEPIGDVWVEATAVRGGESMVGGAVQASQAWRLEMDFATDVTTDDRIGVGEGDDWMPVLHRLAIDRIFDPDGTRTSLVVFGTAAQAFDLSDAVEAG